MNIYDRILDKKDKLIKEGENPDTLVCNRYNLEEIAEIYNREIISKNHYVNPADLIKWYEIKDCFLFELNIEYNERVKDIRVY